MRGPPSYNFPSSSSHSFGPQQARSDAVHDPSPLDAIREQTSKIEDWLDAAAEPIKPYLPAIGRFLIVVTFLEDALRIITQWSEQLYYLNSYRRSEYTPRSFLRAVRRSTSC